MPYTQRNSVWEFLTMDDGRFSEMERGEME